MLFNAKRFLLILFTILLYSSEAWVSGNASLSVIEPNLMYSYTENFRRTLRSEDYESYWKDKRDYFDAVMAFGQIPIQNFLRELKTAGIIVKELDLTKILPENTAENAEDLKAQSQRLYVRFQISESRGDTQITLQLEKPLDDKKAKALVEAAKKIAFHQFEKTWQEKDEPPVKPDYFQRGLMVYEAHDNYSIGLTLLAQFRTQHKEILLNLLEKHLKEISPKLDQLLKSSIADKKFWLEPKDLISLKEKLGNDFDKKLNEDQHPNKSVFNPNGPLFDDFGRRSTANWGLLKLNLLFVSKTNWKNSESFEGNRGAFETEFTRLIRELH